MKIRLENENDYTDVENLTREAFWNKYRPGCFEHLVIHNLRNNDTFVKELDFVIEDNNEIVASIFYSKASIKNSDGQTINVLTFGPVSVLPKYQHLGYGKKIIEYSMGKANELGWNEIFITGDPDYYKKFGFESSSKYNVFYSGMNRDDEFPFFMIKIFDKDKFDINGGEYSDPECFNINEEELEKFDKQFSPKIKEKREGQLA